MEDSPRILVAPLDWGLGHATRCVPVIEKLLESKAEVILAASNRPYEFLKQEFPQLKIINLEGYAVKYPENSCMTLRMLASLPGMLKGIRKERLMLKQIIKEYSIEAVISDNRYGLSNPNLFSVFITHQLNIKAPRALVMIEPLLKIITRHFIKKFDECWVPDYEGKINLSGDLSHKDYSLPNIHFVGPLSRFLLDEEHTDDHEECYDFVAILSGPEPQRSIMEEILLSQLRNSKLKGVVALGMPETDKSYLLGPYIQVFSHLPTRLLDEYMRKARVIICRPGYSSIMDIASLGKNAVLIPTPGQTEQEYLGQYFMKKKIYVCQQQKSFDLEAAMESTLETTPLRLRYNASLLEERIINLLNSVRDVT